jgi:DNA polymerase elongation subunit (family B)
MPDWLKLYTATIGTAKYKLGIGGLHSQETSQLVVSGEGYVIADFDVASFYPNIILQQGMVPPGVGESFLQVYRSIVDRRIAAKRSGDTVVADSLKITLNGTFGKLGSPYSFLYAPEMLIQVTITGQLALLMLIERLHLAGIECKSANTDGIVLKFKESDSYWLYEVMVWWQKVTGYELERTNYRLVASRDVNNYLAITDKGKVKRKGIFTPAGLMKNPDREIVYEAVSEHIKSGTDIGEHIRGCSDIRKFLTVRTVKGGAAWYDQYLGKAIRFYHSTMVAKQAYIKYAGSGNKVPNSEGCRPMMEMFPSLPSDIDYDYYIGCANALLQEVGYN